MIIFEIAFVVRVLIIVIIVLSLSIGYAIGLDQTIIKWWYNRKRSS